MRPSMRADLLGGALRVGVGRLARDDVEVEQRGGALGQLADQPAQVALHRRAGRCPRARPARCARWWRTRRGVPVVAVVRREQRPSAPVLDLDVGELAHPVVAPRHHLEHHGVVRRARTPRGSARPQPTMRSICAARSAGSSERWSSASRTACWPRARSAAITRRVEAGVAHAPGEAAHHGVPQLGGADQVVEHPLVALADVGGQRVGVAQPPAQQVEDHRHVRARRAGARGTSGTAPRTSASDRLEVGHAVVGERPAQLGPERLGQPLGVGVAGAQVGVEVLLRVARLLAPAGSTCWLSSSGPRRLRDSAREVGEDAARSRARRRSTSGRRRAGPARAALRAAEQRTGVALVDVVAEHEVAQRGERVGGHGRRRRSPRPAAWRGPRQRRALGTADRRASSASGSSRNSFVPPSTWVFGATRISCTRPETGASQRRLQLHALDDGDDVARRHLVARPRPGSR